MENARILLSLFSSMLGGSNTPPPTDNNNNNQDCRERNLNWTPPSLVEVERPPDGINRQRLYTLALLEGRAELAGPQSSEGEFLRQSLARQVEVQAMPEVLVRPGGKSPILVSKQRRETDEFTSRLAAPVRKVSSLRRVSKVSDLRGSSLSFDESSRERRRSPPLNAIPLGQLTDGMSATTSQNPLVSVRRKRVPDSKDEGNRPLQGRDNAPGSSAAALPSPAQPWRIPFMDLPMGPEVLTPASKVGDEGGTEEGAKDENEPLFTRVGEYRWPEIAAPRPVRRVTLLRNQEELEKNWKEFEEADLG